MKALLKVLLDSLLELDETNSRLLKTLTAVLIRMNDKEKLEGYLKRRFCFSARGWRDARKASTNSRGLRFLKLLSRFAELDQRSSSTNLRKS
jgi:hypothetical protein